MSGCPGEAYDTAHGLLIVLAVDGGVADVLWLEEWEGDPAGILGWVRSDWLSREGRRIA